MASPKVLAQDACSCPEASDGWSRRSNIREMWFNTFRLWEAGKRGDTFLIT
jgi:hypothetical protein